jgi:hypothetical protein
MDGAIILPPPLHVFTAWTGKTLPSWVRSPCSLVMSTGVSENILSPVQTNGTLRDPCQAQLWEGTAQRCYVSWSGTAASHCARPQPPRTMYCILFSTLLSNQHWTDCKPFLVSVRKIFKSTDVPAALWRAVQHEPAGSFRRLHSRGTTFRFRAGTPTNVILLSLTLTSVTFKDPVRTAQ